jgi:hypothetical protein
MKKPKIIKMTSGDTAVYLNPSQIRRITVSRGNGSNSVKIKMAGSWEKLIGNATDYMVDKIAALVRENYNVVRLAEGNTAVNDNGKNLTVLSVTINGVTDHVFPRGLASVTATPQAIDVTLSDGEHLVLVGDFVAKYESAKPLLALA